MTDGSDIMRLNTRKIEKRLRRIKRKYQAKPTNDKKMVVGGGRINFRRELGDYISPTMLRWFLQSRMNLGNALSEQPDMSLTGDTVAQTLESIHELVDGVSKQPETVSETLADDAAMSVLTSVKELVDGVSKQPETVSEALADDAAMSVLTSVKELVDIVSKQPETDNEVLADDAAMSALTSVKELVDGVSKQPETGNEVLAEDAAIQALTSVKELVDIVSKQPETGDEVLADDVISQTLMSVNELVDAVSKQPTIGDETLADDVISQTLMSVNELVDAVSKQPETGDEALADDVISQTLTSVNELVDAVSKQPTIGDETLADDVISQTLEGIRELVDTVSKPSVTGDEALADAVITQTLTNVSELIKILSENPPQISILANMKKELSDDSKIYKFEIDKLPSRGKLTDAIGDMAGRFGSNFKDKLDSLYTDDDMQRYEVEEYMETINSDDKNRHNYRKIIYDADGSHILRESDDYEHKWQAGQWKPENNREAVYSIGDLNDKLPASDRVFLYNEDGSKKPIYTKEYTKHNWIDKAKS